MTAIIKNNDPLISSKEDKKTSHRFFFFHYYFFIYKINKSTVKVNIDVQEYSQGLPFFIAKAMKNKKLIYYCLLCILFTVFQLKYNNFSSIFLFSCLNTVFKSSQKSYYNY
jgi:hypothetical protein